MRTAIMFGCMCISDAIRADWFPKDSKAATFFGIIIMVMMAMDIIDFFNKNKK